MKKIADVFNDYFANVVTSLEISEFDTTDQLSENIAQPTLETIVKYCNHPSITTINQVFPNKYFNFSIIEKENIFDQIMKPSWDVIEMQWGGVVMKIYVNFQ